MEETTNTPAPETEAPIYVFDAEAVYDEKIAPMMDQVIEICQAHGIPMIASFCYASQGDKDGHDYCTTILPRTLPDGRSWQTPDYKSAGHMVMYGTASFVMAATGGILPNGH